MEVHCQHAGAGRREGARQAVHLLGAWGGKGERAVRFAKLVGIENTVGMTCPDGEDRLFEVPVVEPVAASVKRRVDKTFRAYDPDQVLLMPPSIDDWLPEDHVARFVSELVDETVDLGPFLDAYTEGRGFPPYDPRLMVKLVIYGYVIGVRSARGIEKACHDDVAFRFLAANATPDQRSISRFRRRHLQALKGLFVESLVLCRKAGMVRFCLLYTSPSPRD